MDAALEKKLAEKFPKILRDMGGSPMKTCMAWGLECGNGWYKLLEDSMEKIQLVCDLATSSGTPTQLVASQIKEKFGTLSFYYFTEGEPSRFTPEKSRLVADILSDLIACAERESASVCEETGERGALCARGGWLRTLSRPAARASGYKANDPDLEEYWLELDSQKTKAEQAADPNPDPELEPVSRS